MKKVFIPVLTLVLAVSLAACSFNPFVKKANKDDYYMGSGETKEDIDTVEINWVGGDIDIVYGNSDKIIITEVSKETLKASQVMRWGVDGKTLSVDFHDQKGMVKVDVPNKDLKVELPKNKSYKVLEINTVAGDVSVSSKFDKTTVNSVAGKVTVTSEKADDIKVHSVDADVEITAGEFSRLDADTVSGKITVNLPDNADCKGEITSLSGRIQIDLDSRKDEDKFIFGKGSASISIATLSGDILVKAK
ncbi:MAG: DUF4097 domain-containing protein [Clostridia bacterium]|nr:DUF4097 domain-containing protein [Clostridia bacterium]